MTLQQKTILGIGLLFGAFALVIVSISQTLLTKSYSELENDQALLQVKYLREGVDQLGKDVDASSQSWAKYLSSRPYLSDTTTLNTLRQNASRMAQGGINLVIVNDIEGNTKLKSFIDPNATEQKELENNYYALITDSVRRNFLAGNPKSVKGIIRIPEADITLYIKSEPIYSHDNSDLATGFMVQGRRINSDDIRHMRTLAQTSLDFAYTGSTPVDRDWSEAMSAFSHGEQSYIKAKNLDTLSIFTTFTDLDNKPILNIRVDAKRTFYQRGRDTLRLFTVITVSVGLLAIVASYGFMEKYLIWRIRLLGTQLATIRRKKNPTLRLTVTGRDELGTLTEDINQTLVALDEEQRQREMAQREHKVIVDSLKEVIFRIDVNGKWTYLNPAWKDLTGYSERETLEQYFGKSIFVDDLAVAQELVDSLIDGQVESGTTEVRYHTKSGAIRWVQLFARVTRDGKGDISGLTGTLFDVTERMNTEKKLRESEKLYRLVSENSTDMIFRLTLQGDILYTSRACIAILGYTPEELRNTWIYDYCHPDDSLRVQKAYQKILEKGISLPVEHQIRTKGGHYLWVESVGKPITDENGKPIIDESGRLMELIVTIRDITERKNSEAQLMLREKALANASCGVLIADAHKENFPTIYANKGFERMTGYAMEEWMNKPGFFIGGTETNKADVELLKKGFSESSDVDITLLCYRKDGATFWGRTATSPLYDRGGKLTHFISVITDVSDIKMIQGELEKAKDAAEGANRAKSDFLATMSHEIRTPMNAIVGFAELLSNTPLTEEQREYISYVNSSANALRVTIDDILDFSKAEANKFVMDPQPTVLAQVVDEAVNMIKPRADGKGLKLICNVSADIPVVVIVDGPRLRQILANLLSNSVKFTQKGSITVTVHNEPIDDISTRLFFEVSDTGIGIPEDKVGKLFQSFSQVDSSTTRKFGGTGLGLAISKRFCELMGGNISVSSTFGKGSTFKFDILVGLDQELLVMPSATTVTGTTVSPMPVNKAGTPSPFPSVPAVGAPKAKLASKSPFAKPNAHTDEQPYRILVVEDNPANQLVLLKMLCQMNLSADVANHGKEAMELWAKSPYQVVLTDLQMPEMDGIELTKTLRDREKNQGGTPCYIVGVTANVLPEHRDKCMAAGMDDFMVKPIKMADLKRALAKYHPTAV